MISAEKLQAAYREALATPAGDLVAHAAAWIAVLGDYNIPSQIKDYDLELQHFLLAVAETFQGMIGE